MQGSLNPSSSPSPLGLSLGSDEPELCHVSQYFIYLPIAVCPRNHRVINFVPSIGRPCQALCWSLASKDQYTNVHSLTGEKNKAHGSQVSTQGDTVKNVTSYREGAMALPGEEVGALRGGGAICIGFEG